MLIPSVPEVPEVLSSQSKVSGDKAAIDSFASEIKGVETEILKRFGELPLTDAAYWDRRAYRLILLPSFNNPLFVETQAYESTYSLKIKKLSGE